MTFKAGSPWWRPGCSCVVAAVLGLAGHLSGGRLSRREGRSQCPPLLLECQVSLKWRARLALSGSGLGDSAPDTLASQGPHRPCRRAGQPPPVHSAWPCPPPSASRLCVPDCPGPSSQRAGCASPLEKGLVTQAPSSPGPPTCLPLLGRASASTASAPTGQAQARFGQAFQPSSREAPTSPCRVRSSSQRSWTIAVGPRTGPGLQQGVQTDWPSKRPE